MASPLPQKREDAGMGQKMPSLDSSTLFQTLRRINPAVNIILMSGSASAAEELKIDESEDTFLLKPFSTESLLLALKSSL